MDERDDPLLLDDETRLAAEDEATERIFDGLQRWARALFVGIVAANVYEAMTRLNNPSLRVPLIDALVDVMRGAGFMGVDVARQQMEAAGLAGGVDFETVNTAVLRWALGYNYQLVGGLTDTTRNRLALELARFVESGESLQSLIRRLSDPNAGLFSKDRARRIAATEVTRAYYEGNMEAWRASGMVKRIQWQTANDEIVKKCPICWPMQGKVTDIDKPFEHPTLGAIKPPAHVNCRCDVIPYVEVTVPEGWRPKYGRVTVTYGSN